MSQPSPCLQSSSPCPAPPHKADGEPRPRGVQRAAYRRHFRCFDAMLDGPHSPSALDDVTCCRCSAPWPGHAHRKPARPDEAPPTGPQPRRQRKRVVLVKNGDPAVRRNIVLHLRSLRSLRIFLEEVSELMRFHVCKLYTLDRHKIDSVQSLMQCPSVLVCVGPEPFHPFVLESFRRKSEERLPRVPTKSRSIISTEGQEGRKNGNFGLETKKSIIHPRSNSTTRSTRFSLSSEKSFPNGLGNSGFSGTCQHVKESLAGDDIEKRVIVNKNGSISVEMRVRFHLLNDETLQWSTEVKKSPGTIRDQSLYLQQSNSESCSETDSVSAYEAEEAYITNLYQRHLEDPHCQYCCAHCLEYEIWKSQMQVDLEAVRQIRSSSSSASSHTVVCKKSSVDSTRTMSRSSQEYIEQMVEKAENGDTTVEYCAISCSYSHSEVCSVNATSKSQASTVEENENMNNTQTSAGSDTRPASGGSVCSRSSETDQVSVNITQVSDEVDRPLSAISHSSQVLQTLKEDQDDDSDLPPSDSRASSCFHNDKPEDDEIVRSVCKSASSVGHLTPRPPRVISACSVHSTSSKKTLQAAPADQQAHVGSENPSDDEKDTEARASSVVSSKSNASANSKNSDTSSGRSCGRTIAPQSVVSDNYGQEAMSPADNRAEEEGRGGRAERTLSATSNTARSSKSGENGEDKKMEDRPQSTLSGKTNASVTSTKSDILNNMEKNQQEYIDDRTPSAMSARSNASARSRKSCRSQKAANHSEKNAEVECRAASALSAKSNVSVRSRKSGTSKIATKLNAEEEETRAASTLSTKSHTSTKSRKSKVSEKAEDMKGGEDQDQAEARAPSILSVRSQTSTRSRKSKVSEKANHESEEESGEIENRAPSVLSAKSNFSMRSRKSKVSEKAENGGEEPSPDRAPSSFSAMSHTTTRSRKSQVSEEDENKNVGEDQAQDRAPSATSAKSNTSTRSRKSKMPEKGEDEIGQGQENTTGFSEEKRENRSPSALSAKSDISAISRKSKMSESATELKAEEEKETENRAPSGLSTKSHTSTRSRKYKVSEKAEDENVGEEPSENRAPSALSVKSDMPKKSKVSETPEDESDDKSEEMEHRAPSTLSVMSHSSIRSRKSKVSEKPGDESKGEELSQDRAPSALSVMSHTSSRSRKSMRYETGEDKGQENASDFSEEKIENQSPSALSTKSDISARSRKSIISEKAAELQAEEEEERETRAPSILSAKSHTSTRSRKSKVSEKTEDENEEESEEVGHRAPSPLSVKSNVSIRSKKSEGSETALEKNGEGEENCADINRKEEKMEVRPVSSLSNKSNISARCTKSRMSESGTELNIDEETETTIPRALSAKSNTSTRSRKSKTSEKGETGEGKEHATDFSEEKRENQSPSALSTKSDISVRSRTSRISEKAPELKAEEEEEERKTRAPSSLSVKSNTTAQSRKSQVSGKAEEKKRAEELIEDRAPSTLSVKSNMSTRSNKSKLSNKLVHESREETSEHRAPNCLSVKSYARSSKSTASASGNVSDENGEQEEHSVYLNVEEDTDIRTPSTLSAKSNISTRSRRSKVSEKAAEVNAGQEDAGKRTPSVLSSRTNASERSRKSNLSNCRSCGRAITPQSVISNTSGCHIIENAEEKEVCASADEGEYSARSRMSKTHDDSVEDPAAEFRAPSTLSIESNISAKSRTSTVSENLAVLKQEGKQEEREDMASRAASALSKSSASLKMSEKAALKNGAGEDETEHRALSTMSAISNTSGRSHTSKESEVPTHETAKGEAEEMEDRKLSTASSKQESHSCERAPSSESVLCDQDREEMAQRRSGSGNLPKDGSEHTVGADKERVSSATSIRSKKSSQTQCSACERALTPTLTSVSIGLVDEQDAGDINETKESAMSMNSRASPQSNNSTSIPSRISEKCPPTSEGSEMADENEVKQRVDKTEDRAKSAVSPRMEASDQNKKSKRGSHLNVDNDRVPSSMSKSASGSVCRKTLNKDLRPSSKASNRSINLEKGDAAKDSTNEINSRPVSSASVRSSTSRSKVADNIASVKEGNTKLSNVSSNLLVTEHDVESEDKNENSSICSIKSSRSNKKSSPVISVTSQNQLSPYLPKGSPKKSKTPIGFFGTSNDSTRTHSDVLQERVDRTRPATTESKSSISDKTCNGAMETPDCIRNITGSKNSQTGRSRHIKCVSPSQKKEVEDMTEIVPSSLPNASPSEVVNEWLKKIPSDSSIYEVGDELIDNSDVEMETLQNQMENAVGPIHKELLRGTEEASEAAASQSCGEEEEPQEAEAKVAIDEENIEPCHEEPTATDTPKTDVPPCSDNKCPITEALPNSCHSSVQLMKVLLSPKLYRCNSLPDVSPVYGRKLSNSAKGLLDCLANLQLIDTGSADSNDKHSKYEELMNILQSLWLTVPSDSEQPKKQRKKFKEQRSAEDEITPRSSSGVDLSSGSAGSGKSSANGSSSQIQKRQPAAEGRGKNQDELCKLLEETEENECVGNSAVSSPKSVSDAERCITSDPATPDIANRVQLTPEIAGSLTGEKKWKGEEGPASDETIRSNETLRETLSSSNKSSANDLKALKFPEGIETDPKEDTSSGTSPSVQEAQIANKLSQDTGPVWVLKLLNKMEKQFMTHYVNAMTEFKTLWNLEDNEQLDTMINELRDAVHMRIRSSIDKELKKILGYAGKVPSPPKKAMSRESTMQTEQRRRRLKVMHNQSIDAQMSDEHNTATGTEFSDQLSEDDYCPCDTCMKKKMALRPAGPFEPVSSAPVMRDFDLRKILNFNKKSPTNIPGEQCIEETDKCDLAKGDAMQVGKFNLEIVGHNETEKKRNEEEQNNVTASYENGSEVESEIQEEENGHEVVKYLEDSAGEMDANAKKEEDEKCLQDEKEKDESLDVKMQAVKVGNQENAGGEDEVDGKVQIDEDDEEEHVVNEDTEALTQVEAAEAANEIEVAGDETTDAVAEADETAEGEPPEEDEMAEGGRPKAEDDGADGEMVKEKPAEELGTTVAEEPVSVEGGTAEEDETADNDIAVEDAAKPKQDTAERHATVVEKDELPEGDTDQATEDETGEGDADQADDDIADDEIAEEVAEDDEMAERNTAEEGETTEAEEDETKKGEIETAEDETAERDTVVDKENATADATEDEAAKDEKTEGNETEAEEDETAGGDTTEADDEMAEVDTAEAVEGEMSKADATLAEEGRMTKQESDEAEEDDETTEGDVAEAEQDGTVDEDAADQDAAEEDETAGGDTTEADDEMAEVDTAEAVEGKMSNADAAIAEEDRMTEQEPDEVEEDDETTEGDVAETEQDEDPAEENETADEATTEAEENEIAGNTTEAENEMAGDATEAEEDERAGDTTEAAEDEIAEDEIRETDTAEPEEDQPAEGDTADEDETAEDKEDEITEFDETETEPDEDEIAGDTTDAEEDEIIERDIVEAEEDEMAEVDAAIAEGDIPEAEVDETDNTTEDKIVEGNIAEVEEDETAEGDTTEEEYKIAERNAVEAEEDKTAESDAAIAEEDEPAEGDIAEAEEDEFAERDTTEPEDEIAERDTVEAEKEAEEDKTAETDAAIAEEDELAEGGIGEAKEDAIAQEDTVDEMAKADDAIADEDEPVEGESAEEDERAEDVDEELAESDIAEKQEAAEEETLVQAEEDGPAEKQEEAEKAKTSEEEAAEEDETANNEDEEEIEGETTEAEDKIEGETIEAEEDEMPEGDMAVEGEIVEGDPAEGVEDGRTKECETVAAAEEETIEAQNGKTADEGNVVEEDYTREREIDDQGKSEVGKPNFEDTEGHDERSELKADDEAEADEEEGEENAGEEDFREQREDYEESIQEGASATVTDGVGSIASAEDNSEAEAESEDGELEEAESKQQEAVKENVGEDLTAEADVQELSEEDGAVELEQHMNTLITRSPAVDRISQQGSSRSSGLKAKQMYLTSSEESEETERHVPSPSKKSPEKASKFRTPNESDIDQDDFDF